MSVLRDYCVKERESLKQNTVYNFVAWIRVRQKMRSESTFFASSQGWLVLFSSGN